MIIALLDPEREFSRLCVALGEPELASNPLFATSAARQENAEALYAILLSQLEARPIAEWRRKFREHDIKWSPMPTLEQAARDPQMRECGAIVNLDRPMGNTVETVDSPIFVAGSEKRKPQAPPDFGADTLAILKAAGYSDADIDLMIRSGVAVAGDKATNR